MVPSAQEHACAVWFKPAEKKKSIGTKSKKRIFLNKLIQLYNSVFNNPLYSTDKFRV